MITSRQCAMFCSSSCTASASCSCISCLCGYGYTNMRSLSMKLLIIFASKLCINSGTGSMPILYPAFGIQVSHLYIRFFTLESSFSPHQRDRKRVILREGLTASLSRRFVVNMHNFRLRGLVPCPSIPSGLIGGLVGVVWTVRGRGWRYIPTGRCKIRPLGDWVNSQGCTNQGQALYKRVGVGLFFTLPCRFTSLLQSVCSV